MHSQPGVYLDEENERLTGKNFLFARQGIKLIMGTGVTP